MQLTKEIKYFAIFTAVLFFYPKLLHAYIDPGTGSYFLQMLIAGLIGALFAIKLYWVKIKDFFKGLFKKKNNDAGQ